MTCTGYAYAYMHGGVSLSVVSTLCDLMDGSLRGSSPWNFPGKNIGVGSHSLFQEIFPIQKSNPGLLHCKKIPYCLSHMAVLMWEEMTQIQEHLEVRFSGGILEIVFHKAICQTRIHCSPVEVNSILFLLYYIGYSNEMVSLLSY